ncbi:hypothetical protein [Pseudobacter ginsenosidimutans]|uniref:PadR family transcriptional regulator n=1 Tax=Pseudobacter ginsenosidimutans TaxID=661488 RepID=A0A4Q7N4E1_9BACT|nr:hypothetical protein [Pseudobacter ginsenosidimutans]QEC44392.1 hypothetical protein FSB84_22955 [Pseudobacter ginsenosidimutans]RZS75861.1 hypothetical protein EV199_1736 [Pseudobacter ginsenosidimutans]
MEIKKHEKLLFLLLLNKMKAWNNSIELIRVLEFKFGIFYFNDLVNSILHEEFITREYEGQVGSYFLTQKGIDVLNKDYLGIQRLLLTQYPDQNDFLNSIFARENLNK